MKTQNSKLDFTRNSVVELNDSKLKDVNGGSTLVPTVVITISIITTTINAVE